MAEKKARSPRSRSGKKEKKEPLSQEETIFRFPPFQDQPDPISTISIFDTATGINRSMGVTENVMLHLTPAIAGPWRAKKIIFYSTTPSRAEKFGLQKDQYEFRSINIQQDLKKEENILNRYGLVGVDKQTKPPLAIVWARFAESLQKRECELYVFTDIVHQTDKDLTIDARSAYVNAVRSLIRDFILNAKKDVRIMMPKAGKRLGHVSKSDLVPIHEILTPEILAIPNMTSFFPKDFNTYKEHVMNKDNPNEYAIGTGIYPISQKNYMYLTQVKFPKSSTSTGPLTEDRGLKNIGTPATPVRVHTKETLVQDERNNPPDFALSPPSISGETRKIQTTVKIDRYTGTDGLMKWGFSEQKHAGIYVCASVDIPPGRQIPAPFLVELSGHLPHKNAMNCIIAREERLDEEVWIGVIPSETPSPVIFINTTENSHDANVKLIKKEDDGKWYFEATTSIKQGTELLYYPDLSEFSETKPIDYGNRIIKLGLYFRLAYESLGGTLGNLITDTIREMCKAINDGRDFSSIPPMTLLKALHFAHRYAWCDEVDRSAILKRLYDPMIMWCQSVVYGTRLTADEYTALGDSIRSGLYRRSAVTYFKDENMLIQALIKMDTMMPRFVPIDIIRSTGEYHDLVHFFEMDEPAFLSLERNPLPTDITPRLGISTTTTTTTVVPKIQSKKREELPPGLSTIQKKPEIPAQVGSKRPAETGAGGSESKRPREFDDMSSIVKLGRNINRISKSDELLIGKPPPSDLPANVETTPIVPLPVLASLASREPTSTILNINIDDYPDYPEDGMFAEAAPRRSSRNNLELALNWLCKGRPMLIIFVPALGFIKKVCMDKEERQAKLTIPLDFTKLGSLKEIDAVIGFQLFSMEKVTDEDTDRELPYTRNTPLGCAYYNVLHGENPQKIDFFDVASYPHEDDTDDDCPFTSMTLSLDPSSVSLPEIPSAPSPKVPHDHSIYMKVLKDSYHGLHDTISERIEYEQFHIRKIMERYFEHFKSYEPYRDVLFNIHVPRFPSCAGYLPASFFFLYHPRLLDNPSDGDTLERILDIVLSLEGLERSQWIKVVEQTFEGRNAPHPLFQMAIRFMSKAFTLYANLCEYTGDYNKRGEACERFINVIFTQKGDCEDKNKLPVAIAFSVLELGRRFGTDSVLKERTFQSNPVLYWMAFIMQLFVPCGIQGAVTTAAASDKSGGESHPICHIYGALIPRIWFLKGLGISDATAQYPWESQLSIFILEGTGFCNPFLKPYQCILMDAFQGSKTDVALQKTVVKSAKAIDFLERHAPVLETLEREVQPLIRTKGNEISSFYREPISLYTEYFLAGDYGTSIKATDFTLIYRGEYYGCRFKDFIGMSKSLTIVPTFRYTDEELAVCRSILSRLPPLKCFFQEGQCEKCLLENLEALKSHLESEQHSGAFHVSFFLNHSSKITPELEQSLERLYMNGHIDGFRYEYHKLPDNLEFVVLYVYPSSGAHF